MHLQDLKLCKNNGLCEVAMLHVKKMVCGVAINSTEITVIL